jgi:hypothetical protein
MMQRANMPRERQVLPDYRLYFLDQRGHIARATDLDCRDDAEAIETVVAEHAQTADFAMELWRLDRLVRRFDPTDIPERLGKGAAHVTPAADDLKHRLAIYEFRLLSRVGHLISNVRLEFTHDAAALATIGPFTGTFPIEVWEGERLVRRFETLAPKR